MILNSFFIVMLMLDVMIAETFTVLDSVYVISNSAFQMSILDMLCIMLAICIVWDFFMWLGNINPPRHLYSDIK